MKVVIKGSHNEISVISKEFEKILKGRIVFTQTDILYSYTQQGFYKVFDIDMPNLSYYEQMQAIEFEKKNKEYVQKIRKDIDRLQKLFNETSYKDYDIKRSLQKQLITLHNKIYTITGDKNDLYGANEDFSHLGIKNDYYSL